MASNRSIFVDVGSTERIVAPQIGAIDAGKTGARRAIAAWLALMLAMVICLVLVGGLTRLTDSGLSITEWKPVTGALPPISAQAWDEEFQKYRAIPEYQLQNKGMSLTEFKFIYWWEWGHRQLARMIGLVWALGFFWFLARRQIPAGWTGKLLLLGALGGLQGAIGWWMVSSGLTGRMLDVASYRLATHLGLAFIILCFIGWFRWQLLRPEVELYRAARDRDRGFVALSTIYLVIMFGQILLGALVAGIDAGRSYSEWPMMAEGEFLPSEAFDLQPFWTNFTENAALVQFNHRMLGYVTLAFTGFVWWRAQRQQSRALKRIFNWVGVLVLAQMILGIVTVVTAAPWQIAIVHQFGAILVILSVLYARFLAAYPRAEGIR